MKRTLVALVAALCVFAVALAAAPAAPKTVIHIITVKWKADATPAQIEAALDAAKTMNYPGLKNVWTRPIKMQLPEGYKQVIVMEFDSEQALKDYANSEAQKTWYKTYQPIREESRTHDVTN